MARSEAVQAAVDALIADIDEKFTAANGPLINELKAQIADEQAKEDADQAEIARLQGIVDAAEADTVAAIQSVKDHVDNLSSSTA